MYKCQNGKLLVPKYGITSFYFIFSNNYKKEKIIKLNSANECEVCLLEKILLIAPRLFAGFSKNNAGVGK